MAGFWRNLSLPGLQTGTFLLCPQWRERKQRSLLMRTLILSDQGPTLMTSFSFYYFLEGPSSNVAIQEVGLQGMK